MHKRTQNTYTIHANKSDCICMYLLCTYLNVKAWMCVLTQCLEIIWNKQLANKCFTCRSFFSWLDAQDHQSRLHRRYSVSRSFRVGPAGSSHGILRLRPKQVKALKFTAYTGPTGRKLCKATLVTERITQLLCNVSCCFATLQSNKCMATNWESLQCSSKKWKHTFSQACINFALSRLKRVWDQVVKATTDEMNIYLTISMKGQLQGRVS